MNIHIYEDGNTYRVLAGEPIIPVTFEFDGRESSKKINDLGGLGISSSDGKVVIEKGGLGGLREHVLGLGGEKAVELDRKRKRYVMWNLDCGVYQRFQDPLYVNIPFLITVEAGRARGILHQFRVEVGNRRWF